MVLGSPPSIHPALQWFFIKNKCICGHTWNRFEAPTLVWKLVVHSDAKWGSHKHGFFVDKFTFQYLNVDFVTCWVRTNCDVIITQFHLSTGGFPRSKSLPEIVCNWPILEGNSKSLTTTVEFTVQTPLSVKSWEMIFDGMTFISLLNCPCFQHLNKDPKGSLWVK